MTRIAVIADKSFAGDVLSIDADAIWSIDSPQNRSAIETSPATDTERSRVRFFGKPGDDIEDAVMDAFHAIGDLYPDWETIDYLGIGPNPNLVPRMIMPQGVLSGLYVAQLAAGFRLQKVPPQARPDRFEVWRRNKPPPGTVKITDRALQRVIEIRDHLRQQEPDEDWIPALNWGSRSSKGPNDPAWRDLGLGFDLGFFPRQKVPPDVVERRGDVEIIFRLGLNLSLFAGKEIDYVSGSGFVVH